jgi:hypothetical protein
VQQLPFKYAAARVDGLKEDLCLWADMATTEADHVPNDPSSGFPLFPQVPTQVGAVQLGGTPQLDDSLVIAGCVAYVDQLHTSEVKSPVHHTWFCYTTFDTLNKLGADIADKAKYPDGKKVLPTMNCLFFQGAD